MGLKRRRWDELELSEKLGYWWVGAFLVLILGTAGAILGPHLVEWWNAPPEESAAAPEKEAPAGEAKPAEGKEAAPAEAPKGEPKEEPKKEGLLTPRPREDFRLAAQEEGALHAVCRADRFAFLPRGVS